MRHLVCLSAGALVPIVLAACVSQRGMDTPASTAGPVRVASAPTPCASAVSESRMLCVSGAMCVRELSQILRSCASDGRPACSTSREALLAACGGQSDWYGTEDCRRALRDVEAHCAH